MNGHMKSFHAAALSKFTARTSTLLHKVEMGELVVHPDRRGRKECTCQYLREVPALRRSPHHPESLTQSRAAATASNATFAPFRGDRSPLGDKLRAMRPDMIVR